MWACNGAAGGFFSRLRLSHFRSYKSLDLVLEGRSVVLFGANGSGKTNILEAMSLLSPGRGLRRASNEDMIRRPEAIGWKISSTFSEPLQTHEIVLSTLPGKSRSVEIDAKIVPQLALGALFRVLWLVPAMDRLWADGAEQRRRFLDRIALSFEPAHGGAVLGYEKAMRERNRLLKDQVRDPHWYKALEKQMAAFGGEIIKNRQGALERLANAPSGAGAGEFPHAALELAYPSDHFIQTGAGLLEVLEHGRARDLAAGRSLTGPHRVDLQAVYTAKGVPARECSTGEQKALLISLVLANLRALLSEKNISAILLLDEVAAHLDPDRRAALYNSLNELGVQTLITGTDEELFEGLQSKALFCRVRDQDGVSEVEVLDGE